jgi:hypothetical protein
MGGIMKRISVQFVVLCVLCLGCCAGLFAQATSQISGTVKDATGSVIAGAEITVTQTATGLTRSATSDASGVYVLPSLPLGPYRMEVKKEGFTTYVQTGIVLQVASAPTIDPVLQVGAVTQTVQVEASTVTVDTSTTGVGQVVNSQSVVELPLNGRQVTQLITLAGASNTVQAGFGQTPTVGNLESSKNYPNEALVSIGGGMLNGTTYLLDGGSHNDPFNNLNMPLPFPDAVQEFKVETSALPAEYGQHSAGAINVVSKSGTNQFHGDAFEFVRNAYFNANDYFAKQSDNLKRNQFGGTIGGPIEKDKVFFFVGYQGTLLRSQPAAIKAVLPTALELAGDFTAYEANCFGNPPVPQTLGAPYVGNVLAPSSVSQQAVNFASYFPVGPEPCGDVTYTISQNQNEHMGLAKVDYHINSKQSLFARYYGTHSLQPSSFLPSQGELSVVNAGTDDTVSSLVLGHTYLVSTAMLNTFHFVYNRIGITKFQMPIVSPTDIGVQGMYEPLPHYSNINITGDFQSAGGFATPGLVNTYTWGLKDDFSLVKGPHQLQFGFSFLRPRQTSTFCVYCNGLFTFDGTRTGSAMADFMAGLPANIIQINISHDNEKWRSLGLYVQDSWKVNPRLTLNYGLRWEPYLAGSIDNNYVSHFDMQDFLMGTHSTIWPNAPAGILYPGDPGFNTGGRPNHTTWDNWAPRIGLSWDPTGHGNTVVKASWGMLFDMPHTLFYYNYATEPLWGSSVFLFHPSFADPWASYPGGNPFPTTQNATTFYPKGGYYESVPLRVHNTYVQQWNLAIQRQIGSSWLFKASYLGNSTIHLWVDREGDPSVFLTDGQFGITIDDAGGCTLSGTYYNPCNSTSSTAARRLLTLIDPLRGTPGAQGPYYAQLELLDDGGTASYNALILSAEHRLTQHFSMLANYTWSHCIGDLQTTELSAPITNDPNNRRYDRGNCSYVDVHHNFNLSGVLQSPHFSSQTLQWIAGNWQLAPILGIHSGSYFNVTTGKDNALVGLARTAIGQRPNLVGSDPYCHPKTVTCWMNRSAFDYPANGTFGNLPMNHLQGPGFINLDLSVSRRFPIKESQALEIRFEFFNVANHPNFLNPGTSNLAGGTDNTSMAASTFGQVQGDVAPRIMQFALKYMF